MLMPTSSPRGIHERAARVAGVDGRIGLDEVLVALDAERVAAGGADDAHRDGLADAERIADGEHDVADLGLARVAERENGKVARRSILITAMSVCGSVPIDLGGELAAVGQRDLHRGRAFNDVIVRQDVAVRADDDARAETRTHADRAAG